MTAPPCTFCAGAPMQEKARIHIAAGDYELVFYQCETCKRITAQNEPPRV